MTATARKIPALRFPEFEGEWEIKKVEQVLKRVGKPVTVENDQMYQQIGIRSHGKGLFHKELVTGEELGGKRVFWVVPDSFIVNIVFAWEQAVAKTTAFEEGMIASHRFPMFQSQEKHPVDLDFILHFFLTNKGKVILEAASPGGAGRNKTLGQKEFERQKIFYPTLPEQQKIAAFLTTIDTRIQQLSRKKALLEQYKKGVMQRVFSQEIRFKDEEGKEFPAWEEKQLGAVFTFCQTNSLSRSLLNYERGAVKNIHYGDIHTKFPTIFDLSKEEVPFINESVDLSKIADENYCKVGDLIIADASEDYKDVGKAIEVVNLAGYKLLAGLHTLIVRDVKNQTVTGFKGYMMQTYNVRQQIMRLATGISVLGISKGNLSKVKLLLPSPPEQQKIAAFLSALDRQINLVSQQLERMQAFKKGLLQQMFV